MVPAHSVFQGVILLLILEVAEDLEKEEGQAQGQVL